MTHQAIKDPQDVVDYTLRWHSWLNGDTISTSTWSVDGSESPLTLTVDSNSIGTYTGQSPALPLSQTTVVISSGTVGYTYKLTNHIVTTAGLEADDTVVVKVLNR